MFKALKIAVLLLFLQPQVSNSVVWLLYEFNKDYITQELCENKDKPKLKCEGKCHLAKQLTEVSPTESSEPAEVNYIPQVQLFYQGLQSSFFTIYDKNAIIPEPNSSYNFQPFYEIDEPPRA